MATRTSKYDCIRGKDFSVSCETFDEMWAMMSYMRSHGFKCSNFTVNFKPVIYFSIPEK